MKWLTKTKHYEHPPAHSSFRRLSSLTSPPSQRKVMALFRLRRNMLFIRIPARIIRHLIIIQLKPPRTRRYHMHTATSHTPTMRAILSGHQPHCHSFPTLLTRVRRRDGGNNVVVTSRGRGMRGKRAQIRGEARTDRTSRCRFAKRLRTAHLKVLTTDV